MKNKKFINVSILDAKETTYGEYIDEFKPLIVNTDIGYETEGYVVSNEKSYSPFWVSKEEFLKDNLELISNENLKGSKLSIGEKMVKDFIKKTSIMTINKKTTLVVVTLKNGFEIVESSSCVSEKNYNEAIGAKICIKKIEEKIWAYLGFLLQMATYEKEQN